MLNEKLRETEDFKVIKHVIKEVAELQKELKK